jgi:hypothetical protein
MEVTPATAVMSTHDQRSVKSTLRRESTSMKIAWNAIAAVMRMKQNVSGGRNGLGQAVPVRLIRIEKEKEDPSAMTMTENIGASPAGLVRRRRPAMPVPDRRTQSQMRDRRIGGAKGHLKVLL